MPSVLSWLDYSEHDRRKALDVIDLFRERDTRDELGIGTVRDALSDTLFPGTTTIQTRARYFLMIPWIFQGVEKWLWRRHATYVEIAERLRYDEVQLILKLIESGEKDGVIGYEARKKLIRLPSSIYWQGMESWGIRTFPGSQSAYVRLLEQLSPLKTVSTQLYSPEADGVLVHRWHAYLPERPADFPYGVTLALSKDEARYLVERIHEKHPGSLLSWFTESTDMWDDVSFPWQYPSVSDLPSDLKNKLDHARNFSEIMYGSVLLYNLMLAEKAGNIDLIDRYRKAMHDWEVMIEQGSSRFDTWDRNEFWRIVFDRNPRVPQPSRSFIRSWIDMALSNGSMPAVTDNEKARHLIEIREHGLKGKRARLFQQRALELWSGAAGIGRIDFRWRIVQQILKDILTPLGNGKKNAGSEE